MMQREINEGLATANWIKRCAAFKVASLYENGDKIERHITAHE